MAKKFYAVKRGVRPGVYETWSACEPLVKGFPGAIHKGFPTRQEAEAFVGGECVTEESKHTDENMVYAFVDGSYNVATHVYGYGGFLIHDGQKEVLQGSDTDAEMAAMRNVAGEICGSMAAIRKAVELGLPEVTIYYDYMGIEKWAIGEWKANKKLTQYYADKMAKYRKQLPIVFMKVEAHTGDFYNEQADQLAKKAVGIE